MEVTCSKILGARLACHPEQIPAAQPSIETRPPDESTRTTLPAHHAGLRSPGLIKRARRRRKDDIRPCSLKSHPSCTMRCSPAKRDRYTALRTRSSPPGSTSEVTPRPARQPRKAGMEAEATRILRPYIVPRAASGFGRRHMCQVPMNDIYWISRSRV